MLLKLIKQNFNYSLTAILASIGTGSLSSASLPIILVVLEALNIPTDQLSLIFIVDSFLSRLKTAVNVWGMFFVQKISKI